MTLIDRLQTAAAQLPPSHAVDLPQLASVLGAVVQFLEHGDDFLNAAEDPEQGVIAFLTKHSESENERVRAEAADQAAAQPSQGSVVQAPAVPIGTAPPLPAQGFPPAATMPTGVQAAPGQPDQMVTLLGQLLTELQSERAERAGRDRATVTTPDAEPSTPDPLPAPPPPSADEVAGAGPRAGAGPHARRPGRRRSLPAPGRIGRAWR